MATSLEHRHDHVVVPFTGMLDWPSCIDLVACVDTAIGTYFYRTVEILVTSPGGDAHALAFLISALARWRDQGVCVRTRVSALARSAAAILVARSARRSEAVRVATRAGRRAARRRMAAGEVHRRHCARRSETLAARFPGGGGLGVKRLTILRLPELRPEGPSLEEPC